MSILYIYCTSIYTTSIKFYHKKKLSENVKSFAALSTFLDILLLFVQAGLQHSWYFCDDDDDNDNDEVDISIKNNNKIIGPASANLSLSINIFSNPYKSIYILSNRATVNPKIIINKIFKTWRKCGSNGRIFITSHFINKN